jgi:hypothetical protein
MSGKPGAGHVVEEAKKDGLLMGQLRKLINIIVSLTSQTLTG